MYRDLTIRRMNDPEIRELMKASNTIELGLRKFKRFVKSKQAFRQAVKKAFYDPSQDRLDEIFPPNGGMPKVRRKGEQRAEKKSK